MHLPPNNAPPCKKKSTGWLLKPLIRPCCSPRRAPARYARRRVEVERGARGGLACNGGGVYLEMGRQVQAAEPWLVRRVAVGTVQVGARGIHEFPNRLAFSRRLENPPLPPVSDQRIAVRQPLRPRPVRGIEGFRRVGGVPPNETVGPVGGAGVQTLVIAVGGQSELVHGRVSTLESRVFLAVVEYEDVARAQQPLPDPVGVVRKEER